MAIKIPGSLWFAAHSSRSRYPDYLGSSMKPDRGLNGTCIASTAATNFFTSSVQDIKESGLLISTGTSALFRWYIRRTSRILTADKLRVRKFEPELTNE